MLTRFRLLVTLLTLVLALAATAAAAHGSAATSGPASDIQETPARVGLATSQTVSHAESRNAATPEADTATPTEGEADEDNSDSSRGMLIVSASGVICVLAVIGFAGSRRLGR